MTAPSVARVDRATRFSGLAWRRARWGYVFIAPWLIGFLAFTAIPMLGSAFLAFTDKWERRYPAIIKLWDNAWAEFVPFLRFDAEIRTVVCTTNAIESINARIRRAVNARGHFPTEQAAMKTLYLVTRSLDPKGTGQARWVTRWKPALNAFAVTFADRMPAAENL